MQIVSGGFASPGDEGSLYIPPAILHDGWGEEGSVHVVEQKLPLPNRMSVLSYSFLEDRFYEGTFALPVDSITRLFREGYRSYRTPGGHDTYDVLAVGVAPGGAVAVWANGSERQVEVFFGRAAPANLDWHQALGMPAHVDRRSEVARELDEDARTDSLVPLMMRNMPTADRWAAYRTRYRYRQVFEGVSPPARPERVVYVNGERDYTVRPLEPAEQQASRPVPGFLGFDDGRTKLVYDLTFDEQEIAAAFAKVGAGGRPVELVFAAPPAGARAGGPELQVRVRGDADSVVLRNVKVEVAGPG